MLRDVLRYQCSRMMQYAKLIIDTAKRTPMMLIMVSPPIIIKVRHGRKRVLPNRYRPQCFQQGVSPRKFDAVIVLLGLVQFPAQVSCG